MIVGREEPDSGTIEIGETTRFCYVDQTRQSLRDELTVYEEVADGSDVILYGDKALSVRHYLARFLFSGSIQQTPVGRLSGGERNRLQLAKFLRHPSNFIILDEPTNDLDLMTLRVLEESLTAFPGCAIVITHDRYFLDRVATHILAFEGDAVIEFVPGAWDAYTEYREKKLAETGRDPVPEVQAQKDRPGLSPQSEEEGLTTPGRAPTSRPLDGVRPRASEVGSCDSTS